MLPPDDLSQQPMLTRQQAFQVMAEFLWQYARRAGDDLLTLLGDIELESDGGTADPAAWYDWIECVAHVTAGLPARRELS